MRHAVLAVLTVVSVVVNACSSSNEASSDSGECGEAITRLEAAMAGDISGNDLMFVDPSIEAPTRASGNVTVEVAPIVGIGRTDVLLDGRRVDAQGLIDDLGTLERNWGILHPNAGPLEKRLNVLADARVDFARVDEVLQPLSAQGYSFVLLAATPTVVAPPCPTDWPECASLGTGDPATRAVQVANASTGVLGGSCVEVMELFGRIAGVDADQKAQHLRAGLPPALRACECRGVNMPRLQWLIPLILGTRDARPVGMAYEAGRAGTVGAWMSAN